MQEPTHRETYWIYPWICAEYAPIHTHTEQNKIVTVHTLSPQMQRKGDVIAVCVQIYGLAEIYNPKANTHTLTLTEPCNRGLPNSDFCC